MCKLYGLAFALLRKHVFLKSLPGTHTGTGTGTICFLYDISRDSRSGLQEVT